MQRSSGTGGRARRRGLRLVLMSLERFVHDALNESRVRHPRFLRGVRHGVTEADERVGVRLDESYLVVGGEADVEAGVVTEPEGPERGATDLRDPLFRAFGHGTGEDVADTLALAVRLVPLGQARGDPLFGPGSPPLVHHLHDGKD